MFGRISGLRAPGSGLLPVSLKLAKVVFVVCAGFWYTKDQQKSPRFYELRLRAGGDERPEDVLN